MNGRILITAIYLVLGLTFLPYLKLELPAVMPALILRGFLLPNLHIPEDRILV